jgi:polyhydroxybutyrate depolymerase
MKGLMTLAGCLLVFHVWAGLPPVLTPGFAWMEFEIEGTARQALIYAPASARTNPSPVVFVFHGHGGNARQAARSFAMYEHWPEAISVHMQGLNTPGRLTDPEGRKPGWQSAAGDQGDRDLKFFDAVLARLRREYRVDGARVYSTGHSNGGAFTYLLWAERGDGLAAVAPSAAAASARMIARFKPKPALHLAGRNDPLVKFAWQELTMTAVRRVNGCDPDGKLWGGQATLYPSRLGAPFVAFVHPDGHGFAPGASSLITRFFKEHALRSTVN